MYNLTLKRVKRSSGCVDSFLPLKVDHPSLDCKNIKSCPGEIDLSIPSVRVLGVSTFGSGVSGNYIAVLSAGASANCAGVDHRYVHE